MMKPLSERYEIAALKLFDQQKFAAAQVYATLALTAALKEGKVPDVEGVIELAADAHK